MTAFHLPSAFSESQRHDVAVWTYVLTAGELFDDAAGVHPVESQEPGKLAFGDLGAYVELGREIPVPGRKQGLVRRGSRKAEYLLYLGRAES